MANLKPKNPTTYDAYEVTRRERKRVRDRNRFVAGVLVGVCLLGGNIALFVYRVEFMAWVKKTFGEVELTVGK